MKWREKNQGNVWYSGPEEGRVIHYAKKNGKSYTVQACYRHIFHPNQGIHWSASDGRGTNKTWRTMEAAIAWCEIDAANQEKPD